MTYSPGELDQRVSIYRQDLTPDDKGGNQLNWQLVDTVWMHVRPLRANEQTEYDRLQGQARYLFVARNQGLDVKDSDYLEWEGEQFNIISRLPPKTRALYIEFHGQRGVPQ